MTQKVLITYGDTYGPTVIGAAEKVLKTVAPDLDLLYGKIGAEAYDNTAYALPSETIEMAAECDAILSGPVDMVGIPERNPLTTIKKQMGLFLEYSEFFPLCRYMGSDTLDAVVLSPTVESTLNVYETESLDGVASEYYTSIEAVSAIFSKTMTVAEMKRRNEIRLVSDNVLYPIREKLIREQFHRHFAATEFDTRDSSTAEVMFALAHDPASIDMLVCDIHSSTCMTGLCAGLNGGSGLMPRAFLGERKGLYMPSNVINSDTPGRESNPTSAILSTAFMLLSLGRRDDYDLIRHAVCEMYRMGYTTPDIGGKQDARSFTDNVIQEIRREIHS